MTHLLIVSHNALVTNTISTTLQGEGVTIHSADSSRCIIEICRDQRIDLIIFLSLTPYFSSMNIVEYLRSEIGYLPKVYVISHSHSQATILSLLECGVDQYLTFPINLYRLREKVYTQLSK
ncbi:MAG: response regulator [Rikenellaceae bacterium]